MLFLGFLVEFSTAHKTRALHKQKLGVSGPVLTSVTLVLWLVCGVCAVL